MTGAPGPRRLAAPWLAARLAGPAMVVIGAVAAIGLVVVIAGFDPAAAFGTLIRHALGTIHGLNEVAVRAIPLTLTGLGIAVAFRANIFNVGGDGQIIFGGVAFTGCALAFGDVSGWLVLPAALAAGIAGGAFYGGLAGFLRARYNANEIITTIMLNYIAFQFLIWVVRGPLQENMKIFPRSGPLPDGAVLAPILADGRMHWGLAIALVATLAVHLLLRYSSLGFQIAAVGESQAAARYAGINVARVIFIAMAISGGLAGLAGAVEIAGIHGRLQDAFSEGVGVTAIAVALLARLNPLAVPFTAFLFAALSVGSGALQRTLGIPFPLVHIIEAIAIFSFLVMSYLQGRRAAA